MNPLIVRFVRACSCILSFLFLLSGGIATARAHDLALTGIRILIRSKDTVVTVTTPISRLRRVGRSDPVAVVSDNELDRSVRERLHLRFDGKQLLVAKAHVIADNANDTLVWQTVVSRPVKKWEVTARLYPEDRSSRTVVIVLREGTVFQEVLLDSTHLALLPDQPTPSLIAVALRYVREGIEHILSGADHIVFVLGLLLFGGSVRSLLRTVTAFTVAHSLTLTLAATELYCPAPRIVEPLIAVSIVAIAVENLYHLQKKRDAIHRDVRPFYAFGFGLIHGFGFAGALADIGLPRTALGIALGSFNIGVELGQVAIIGITIPGLLWLAKTRPVLFRRVELFGSAAIGLVGAYWFLSRLLTHW